MARRPLSKSKDFTSVLILDQQLLMQRLVDCFGLETLAKMIYADELIFSESGHGAIEVIYAGGQIQDVKTIVGLQR
jgi:hypothetical protein